MTLARRFPIHLRIGAALLFTALAAAAIPSAASAQATRTWVSGGFGDDVNPCSRTAPCKTLAGSISKTAEGGEINAIDSGGFGSVTITKAITIDLSNTLGGVLNAFTTGVVVNAGADDDVVLRGLDIHGGGSSDPACASNGVNGIRLDNARSLRVENVTIARQGVSAVQLVPNASSPTVLLDNVEIRNNCVNGVNAAPAAGRTVDVVVRDSVISNSGTGIRAADGAHAWLSGSTIFANTTGVLTAGTGIVDGCGDNRIFANTTNGAPTAVSCDPSVTPAPPPPAVAAAASVAPAAAPAPAPAPASASPPAATPIIGPVAAATKKCSVPNLLGLALKTARSRLKQAGCALGKTTKRATKQSRRVGRVMWQGRKAGTVRAAGATVDVRLGRRAA